MYPDLSCRYLQLDDTALAFLTDETDREELAEPAATRSTSTRSTSRRSTASWPGARRTSRSPSTSAAATTPRAGRPRAATPRAEALFGSLEVDGSFLEYDSDRAGTFEPLRFVPEGKQVVLGLVTSKPPQLEDKDELTRRIAEAAQLVPLDQLCLSPQCGFASTEGGPKLSSDEQRAELELVVETAAEVWG